jgi:hypothetical protein
MDTSLFDSDMETIAAYSDYYAERVNTTRW